MTSRARKSRPDTLKIPTRKLAKKQNLTEQRVRETKAPASGRTYIYDTTQPTLALCVTANDTRTYYFVGREHGKYVRTPLGKVGELAVKQAREAASAMAGDAAKGENPVERKRQQAAQQAADTGTVGTLWAYYLESHAKPRKRSWRVDEQRYIRHVKAWEKRPLTTIDPAAVQGLHNKVGKASGHYEANRLRSLLHKMFAVARRIGFTGPNPVDGVPRFREESRERFLHGDEMPRFFAALTELRKESPTAADALEVTLWTGQRRGNVLRMEWEELALDRAEWTVPGSKMKNGRPITVHLPEPAVTILRARQAEAKGQWVFPGRRHGKPLSDPYKPWKALLKASGLKDLRPHDLRRTMGSWQTATGASLQVVGKTLGHADLSSTQIYARLNLDPVKLAVNKAVEAMQAAAAVGNGQDATTSPQANA